MNLDEAVAEVHGLLIGLELELIPELPKYRAITRQLNRALRAVALDHEWSYYSDLETLGVVHEGDRTLVLRSSVRPRIINDDAVRLVNPNTGQVVEWAYWIPRDALHKYTGTDLRVSHTRSNVEFSRPFFAAEEGLEVQIPVMREPRMFTIPPQPEDPNIPYEQIDPDIREQLVDFDYPDLIVRRAAYFYSQTNAQWQPRVQTLEAQYKELMYALTERDTRNTDTPYQNEWNLGIEGDAINRTHRAHRPSADWTVM